MQKIGYCEKVEQLLNSYTLVLRKACHTENKKERRMKSTSLSVLQVKNMRLVPNQHVFFRITWIYCYASQKCQP
jgi:hypothetical protein